MAPEGGSCVRLVSEAEICTNKESRGVDRGSLRMFRGGGGGTLRTFSVGGEGILAYV